MKRSKPLRRSRMRRGSKRSRYALRPRDRARMEFVRTLECSVAFEAPDPNRAPSRCLGPIEADHDSRGRGLGQKSDDSTVIPLCTGHHRERTDHTGSFKYLTRDQVRAWFDRAQQRAQQFWLEHLEFNYFDSTGAR